MAWSIVGVSTSVEVTATGHTLTVPAGVAAGDLLVACISSRIASTTSVTLPTGGEWTLVGEQKANNILSTGSALPSATMAYCVRGASNPNLVFTHPTAPSVALGRIVAYRGGVTPTASAKDTQTSFTTATGITAVSGTGLTTTQADDLIVAMAAGGQEAAWSSFNATTPSGASGATDTTTAPSATWRERAEQITTTGVDTSLGIFDALKTAAGATGNLTVTASVAAGHSVIAGAFKILPTPTADAWNVNDKSANLTLSNSDKTATAIGSGATVHSTQKYTNETAGKYYAEFKIEVKAGTDRYGIQPDSSLAGTLTGAITVSGFNGAIQIAGSGTTPTVGATPVANDIVCMAWDSGSERIWFRLNGGNWNNDASADPATGTNGFDISATIGAVSTALMFYSGGAGSSGTVRTELAEFTQAVPSGFRSWMGEVDGPGALVQSNEGVSTTATTTATFSTAPTAGNLVVLAFAADDYNATPDSGWAQPAEMEQQTYHGSYLWWRISDGSNSLPYTIGTAVNSAWNLLEFSGVAYDAYDTSQGKFVQPATTNVLATDTITPTTGNRLLVATYGASAGVSLASDTGTWTGSFTPVRDIGNATGTTKDFIATAYRLVTGDGSTGFTTTGGQSGATPDSNSALIISFKTNAAFSADKTVTAVAGAYALTGSNTSLELGRKLDASTPGSYALTGQPVTLSKVVSYRLASDAGSYALSGATAGLYRGREVLAVAGSYGLTGTVASLETGREVTADGGSYALTGATTGLELGREVLALSASYAIGGATATLSHGWKIAADGGSYALTGTAATLTKGAAIVHRTLPADAGAYALSGATAGLELGREVLALGGSYALSGATASLEYGREALALGGSYALTGTTASFRQTRLTSAVSGSYALTGQPATFARTWKATALGGTYALTGLPVNLLKPGAYAVIGLPGAYVLSGATAGLEWNREVPALAGSYALAGSAASLEKGREVVADAGAYALTGSPATPIHAVARTVVADGGAYALTGSPAVLTYSGAAPAAYRSIAGTSYASRPLETVVDTPSGTVDGDILIAGIFAGKAGDFVAEAVEIEITPPAGWTQIGSDTEVAGGGFVGTLQVYWKRASGEPSSYAFAHTGPVTTYSTQGVVAAYSGCVPTGNPVDTFSQASSSTGATATATGITPEYTLTKLVYLGHNWDATGSLTAPAGTTERFDDLVYLSDEDRTGSGRTGDRTQILASSNPWAAFLIALKSAVSVFTRLVDAISGSYALTGAEDVILEKTTTGVVATRSGVYRITGEPAVVGHGLFAHGGVYTIVGATASLEIGVEVVEPPVVPIIGGAGGSIPRKQLRKAVRELLRREEKRKGKKKPKVLAREILEAVEAKGLGVREKRIAIRLIGEALRLELPSLFYSQPLIHDKERIARAILFLVRQAMQRLLDEEEDEEAALLLLSAA